MLARSVAPPSPATAEPRNSGNKREAADRSPIFLTSMERDRAMGKDKGPKTQAIMQQCRDSLPLKHTQQASASRNPQDNIFARATGKERGQRSRGTATGGRKKSKFSKPSAGARGGGSIQEEREVAGSPGVGTTESEKSLDQPLQVTDSHFWRKKICRAFQMIDTDRDGHIRRSDFEALARSYRAKTPRASPEQALRCKIMWERESTNLGLADASAVLPLKSYLSKWAERVQRGVQSVRLFEEMFKAIDLEGEGHIYFYQLYMFYRAMGYGMAVEEVNATFNAMDRDRDKMVNLADFVAFHKEYFYTAHNNYNSSILYGPLQRE